MTSWSQLVNEIKRRPPERHLTTTQQQVMNRLCEWLAYPGIFNLYGNVGSGKTYVAWALSRAMGAHHVQIPSQLADLETGHEILIVDNIPHTETKVRQVLAACNLRGASAVVFISHLPITMPMQRIELPLPAPEEIDGIKTDLAYLSFQRSPLPEKPNFWQILQSYS